jgi:hypothetical protein
MAPGRGDVVCQWCRQVTPRRRLVLKCLWFRRGVFDVLRPECVGRVGVREEDGLRYFMQTTEEVGTDVEAGA